MTRVRSFMVNVGYHTRMFPLVTPPISLMALAAYLRQKSDMEIRLVNQRLDNSPPAEVVRQAKEFGPDVMGLSAAGVRPHFSPPRQQGPVRLRQEDTACQDPRVRRRAAAGMKMRRRTRAKTQGFPP